jgi:hypothetical protein
MQKKLSVLLSSQPTQFEKDRPGGGTTGEMPKGGYKEPSLLGGAGTAAWEGIKGIGKGIASTLDPTQGLSGAGLSAIGLNPRSGSVRQRLNEIPIVGAAREARSAFQDPNAGVLDKVTAGPGALVGMSDESARGHAARGESGAIVGEAAVPAAMALSPLATEGAAKGLSAARGAVSRAAYSGGELKPGWSSFADSLQHPTQLPGKIITGAAKKLFPPPPEFPGAPLPSADEFYENRGSDLVNRQAEQEILDRKNEIAARRASRNAPKRGRPSPFPNATSTDKPIGNAEIPPAGSYNPPRFAAGPPTPAPKPLFGNATATNQVVGNAEVPSFRGPSAPPRSVEYVNKFGSPSSQPTEGLIVRHDSPPPPRQVTYQSAAQSDLLKKVMSGDRDAIAEWDRRSLPRPPGVGFMVEPSAPNIPWGKPR